MRLNFTSGTAVPATVIVASTPTANQFTAALSAANTSGNVSLYSQGFRVYLFNPAGVRVSGGILCHPRGTNGRSQQTHRNQHLRQLRHQARRPARRSGDGLRPGPDHGDQSGDQYDPMDQRQGIEAGRVGLGDLRWVRHPHRRRVGRQLADWCDDAEYREIPCR